ILLTARLAAATATLTRLAALGTLSRNAGEGGPARQRRAWRSARLRAGVGGQVLLLRIFLGRFDDHRPDHLLVGVDPVGDEFPLLAVPLVYPGAGNARVVLAGHFERRQQALEAELVELVGGEVQVLQTLTDLL